jgi:hypothetical protein
MQISATIRQLEAVVDNVPPPVESWMYEKLANDDVFCNACAGE